MTAAADGNEMVVKSKYLNNMNCDTLTAPVSASTATDLSAITVVLLCVATCKLKTLVERTFLTRLRRCEPTTVNDVFHFCLSFSRIVANFKLVWKFDIYKPWSLCGAYAGHV